jgi:hypothetical protein
MKNKMMLVFCLAASLASAQTFDVAAIHPNTTGETPLIHALPGGVLSATAALGRLPRRYLVWLDSTRTWNGCGGLVCVGC